MDFEIIDKDGLTVVGLATKTSMASPDYKKDLEKIWMDFIPRAKEIKNIVPGVFYGTYEMEGENNPVFVAMACAEVSSEEDIPEGMKVLKIPHTKYFKVTHEGHNDKLMKTYEAIKEEMKKQGFEGDYTKISFEYYDDRYVHDSEDSACDIYIPLK